MKMNRSDWRILAVMCAVDIVAILMLASALRAFT